MHVGMELAQDSNFSATLPQEEFAKNLQPLPTTPKLLAVRQQLLPLEDVKLRQCKLGELCWPSTVSRPDICARLARIASRINSLQGSDVYRINDLSKTARLWRKDVVFKFAASSQLRCAGKTPVDVKMRHRKEKRSWAFRDHGGTVGRRVWGSIQPWEIPSGL